MLSGGKFPLLRFTTSLVYITNIKNPFKKMFVKESKPNINFRTTNNNTPTKKSLEKHVS